MRGRIVRAVLIGLVASVVFVALAVRSNAVSASAHPGAVPEAISLLVFGLCLGALAALARRVPSVRRASM